MGMLTITIPPHSYGENFFKTFSTFRAINPELGNVGGVAGKVPSTVAKIIPFI